MILFSQGCCAQDVQTSAGSCDPAILQALHLGAAEAELNGVSTVPTPTFTLRHPRYLAPWVTHPPQVTHPPWLTHPALAHSPCPGSPTLSCLAHPPSPGVPGPSARPEDGAGGEALPRLHWGPRMPSAPSRERSDSRTARGHREPCEASGPSPAGGRAGGGREGAGEPGERSRSCLKCLK